MLQELIQTISQKTSLPPDKVQEVVNLIVAHLKDRLPQPLSGTLDHYLAGGAAPEGGLAAEAGSVLGGLSGMFEKKSQ